MLAKVQAPAHIGLIGRVIEVECFISNGLPTLVVVGLGDKAIEEARERIRSAIKNSQLILPAKRIALNLAPADLPKDGTIYDLPMAVAILAASGQVDVSDLKESLFLGELSLDGSLRPVKGALAAHQLAVEQNFYSVYLPEASANEAALFRGAKVYPVRTLHQLYRHLVGEEKITPCTPIKPRINVVKDPTSIDSVYGQSHAKRACAIAAAGCHNLLMSGPPGSGKTMLAKALISLMPSPSRGEIIEIAKLHSLAGYTEPQHFLTRPFRSPHHTTSDIALIGGGKLPRPGEISLSHRGILFLDELPEFSRRSLEALRQPLEDGLVTIARAAGSITLPARFMLVATQNPCPCGYLGDQSRDCSCTPGQVERYRRKISGPLLDRLDLHVHVGRINRDEWGVKATGPSGNDLAARVVVARERQKARFSESTKHNSEMNNTELEAFCQPDQAGKQLLDQAMDKLALSARAMMRVLKVARTIADLDDQDQLAAPHIAEALQYRARA